MVQRCLEDAEDPDRKEIALSINHEDGSKNEDIESHEHDDADDYEDDQDDFVQNVWTFKKILQNIKE